METTLKDALSSLNLDKQERMQINTRLLLLAQLSSLQINIAQEIEQIFNNKNQYKMTIKHNHDKVKQVLKTNYASFFNTLSPEQIDAFCDDADTLELRVYNWAGIKSTHNG